MAISLSSAAMDFSVLRGPWPGDRQAGWRRGSQERKIGAGGTRLVYFIIGESCATRSPWKHQYQDKLRSHHHHNSSRIQQGSASNHLVHGISCSVRPWIPSSLNSGAWKSGAVSTAQALRPKGQTRLTAFLAAQRI